MMRLNISPPFERTVLELVGSWWSLRAIGSIIPYAYGHTDEVRYILVGVLKGFGLGAMPHGGFAVACDLTFFQKFSQEKHGKKRSPTPKREQVTVFVLMPLGS